jgi:hypothetical protein
VKPIGENRGVEQQHLPAQNSGYSIVQLTDNVALESQHTYYDICPWSYDERFIVFSSAPVTAAWTPFGHDTLACRAGRVNVIDTETLEIRELTAQAVYLKHGGAFCMWHPKKHEVFYRKDEEHFAALDLDTGKTHLLPGSIRQISPASADGSVTFVTSRRSSHSEGRSDEIGVMAEDGSEFRLLVNREQLYELTPNRDQFRPEDMTLGNTKWRPDGQYILITAWVYPHPEVRRSLYIVSRDGKEIRWLTYFAHHHSWTPDGHAVLFNDRIPVDPEGKIGPRMFLIDFDGTNRRVIFDRPVGSHPLMHPDGQSIVDSDREGIYVVRLEQDTLERLVHFAQSFDGTHHGTHPHPVWNHDGSRILYNSAESGHSEIYLIKGD